MLIRRIVALNLLYLRSETDIISDYDRKFLNVTSFGNLTEAIDSLSYQLSMVFRVENLTANNIVRSSSGGAIRFANYGWKDPSVFVRNSTFSNCVSSSYGGSLYIESIKTEIYECYFNKSRANSNGGAAYFSGTSTIVSNCVLTNCSSYVGGSFFSSSTDFTSFESIYINSSSSNIGGSLYLSGSNNDINRNSFYDSYSQNGGAIYCSGKINVFLCDFYRCISGTYGGVFYSTTSNTVSFCNCLFYLCSSLSRGGCIYTTGTILSLEKICVNNCSSVGIGSFCYCTSSSSTTFLFTDISVIKGFSVADSTLYLNQGLFYMTGMNLSDNYASLYSFMYLVPYNTFDLKFSCVSNHISSYPINIVNPSSPVSMMKSVNYINNTSNNAHIRFANTYQTVIVDDSIFLQNNAVIFLGYCIVRNCLIQHASIVFSSGIFSTSNNIISFTEFPTHSLQFFSTYLCPTIDLINNLECPTYLPPPSPTQCIAQTQEVQILSNVIPIFLSSMWLYVLIL